MTIVDAAERPTYTASEAARYAGFSTQSVARWRAGYTYPTQQGPRRSEALTGGQTHGLLTFNELLEVAVVAAARRGDVPMKSIRRAIGIAREVYGVDRPLVTMRFMHDGKDIFTRELEQAGETRYVNLSRHGQIAWEYIRDRSETWISRRMWQFAGGRVAVTHRSSSIRVSHSAGRTSLARGSRLTPSVVDFSPANRSTTSSTTSI